MLNFLGLLFCLVKYQVNHSQLVSCRKPVYVVGAERCKWKLSDFHKSLKERGVVQPFTGSEDVSKYSMACFDFLLFLLLILGLIFIRMDKVIFTPDHQTELNLIPY